MITLLPHQKLGADFLLQPKPFGTRGGILAYPVGTGKSFTAAEIIRRAYKRGDSPVLIVCPAVLKHQWRDELYEFNSNLSCTVIDGTKQERQALYKSTADVFIMNYELLRHDYQIILSTQFSIIIGDEIHKIGSVRSAQSKLFRKLKADIKIAMTGTPISNHPSELWPILNWICPQVAGRWKHFVLNFCTFNPWGGVSGVKNLDKLAELIRPFYLAVDKEKVMPELLPAIEEDIEFDLSEEEVRLYEQIRYQLIMEIDKGLISKIGSPISLQNGLTNALRLQQLTGGMPLLGSGQKSSKVEKLTELLNTHDGKAIVYTRFAEYAKLLHTSLAEFEPLMVIGTTAKSKRQDIIKTFNDRNDPHKVLIITDTMSHGVNLQKACSTIVYCETPFSLGKKDQVMGRVHRYLQKEQVKVYYLLATMNGGKKTIDHKIKQISIRKGHIARKVITPSELKELLSDEG